MSIETNSSCAVASAAIDARNGYHVFPHRNGGTPYAFVADAMNHADRPTIVVVSDDPPVLELASSALESAGYNVTTCDKARECYQTIREVQPDLALIAARMGDLDDWHVLTLVLLDRELRSTPILVSSPRGPETGLLERRLLELGCRLITKPFTAEHLLDAVRTTLAERGAA